MYTAKELAAMTEADVAAITPKTIAVELIELARPKLYFKQCFVENRDIEGTGKGDYIDFPKEKAGISFDKVPTLLTEPTATAMAYEYVRIEVERWGGRIQIPFKILQLAQRDVIKDSLRQAANVVAEKKDLEGRAVLLKEKSVTDENVGAGTGAADAVYSLANKPVLGDVSAKRQDTGAALTVKAVDYYNGKVQIAEAVPTTTNVLVSYTYSELPSSQVLDAYTDKAWKFRDIMSARVKLAGEKLSPFMMISHPDEHASLLFDTELKLLEEGVYREKEPMLNGEIGKAGGFKLVTTTQMWPGVVVYLPPAIDVGRWVIQRELETHRRDRPEIDAIEYILWSDFKPGLINEKAVVISVNHASDAASL